MFCFPADRACQIFAYACIYSAKNLKLLSENDNTYIIPVPSNTDVFRNAMKDVKYTDSFYYWSGRKHARIEYMSQRISDTEHVYVFRDIDENEKCRYNYQHCMELGRSGYTQEKFEKSKDVFGVYALQSNSAKSADQVFGGFKKPRNRGYRLLCLSLARSIKR